MTARVPQLSPQEMADLSNLMFQLSHNEKTRGAMARIVAAVDPQRARADFHDIVQDEKLNRVLKKIDDDRMQDRIAKAGEVREAEKQQIIRERKLNADAVKELEKLQTQYGFSSWRAAADIYAQRNPPDDPRLQPPPEVRSSTFDFPTVPGPDGKQLAFKDYIKDPRKYSNDIAYQMITDFKRRRLPASLHA